MSSEKKTAPQGGAVRYELASGYPSAKPITAKLRKAAITALRAEKRRRLLNEVQTVEKAVSLCEDLPELLDSLAETAGDAERRTAVELYAAALRTLLRSAKERL